MQIGSGQRLIFEPHQTLVLPHHVEEEEEDAVRPTPGGGGGDQAGEGGAGAREIVGRGEASEREVRAREDSQKNSEFVGEFGHSESEREASRKLRFWRWRRRLAAWRLKRGLVVKMSTIEEQTDVGGQEEGYVLPLARAAVADGEGGGTGKESAAGERGGGRLDRGGKRNSHCRFLRGLASM